MSAAAAQGVTAVILAGGASRRFAQAGHAIDKLALVRDGESLLEAVVREARHTCDAVVIVGPEVPALSRADWVREDPPGGGPVAALAAALPHVGTGLMALLAGDAPRGPQAVPALCVALGDDCDGAYVHTDRAQYLCGVYRTQAVRHAMCGLASPHDAALHHLLDTLSLTAVGDQDGWSRDIDTPDDARDLGYA